MPTIERLCPAQVTEPDPRPEYLSVVDAGPKLEALSSRTARSILVALGDGPAAPSEIAERVDTSLQNLSYHLANLEAAGLVTVAGTRYSEKGQEMKLYARAVSTLVIGGPTGSDGPRE